MYNILMFVKRLLVITGPTATGKTKLGVELAEEFSGEIISADSRQVYKYLDIGTGKDLKHWQWGVDLVLPNEPFSVADWVKYTIKVVRDVWKREKLPIIVGGTGQYIKELLHPSETLNIPPNEELRSKLSSYQVIKLQEELQKLDKNKWESMNDSDKKNPRRLIRAIEIQKSKFKNQNYNLKLKNFDYLAIGLTAPLEYLYKKIDERVEERIKLGMEEEREKLKKMGYFPDAFGYKETSVGEWKNHERQYAKRQLAYLKKYLPEIEWFDVSHDYSSEICQILSRW
ncbi:tRNA dimethylallyltransferase [Candidatus Gottesmanbacteria bacterium]|nr:tRNA dimethylallyltransferase [Candidatus Gottesmanbacteria bacterium]